MHTCMRVCLCAGSAAGTVLGEVGCGPATPDSATAPPTAPAPVSGEMQALEVLGAGSVFDPSKPGFGLLV